MSRRGSPIRGSSCAGAWKRAARATTEPTRAWRFSFSRHREDSSVRAAIVLLLGSLALPCAADTPAFAAIALHDVVDTERELDADAITTDRLVGLLEWMKASGVRA